VSAMLPTGTVKSGGSRQAIAKLNLTDRVRCETNLPKTTLIGNSRHLICECTSVSTLSQRHVIRLNEINLSPTVTLPITLPPLES